MDLQFNELKISEDEKKFTYRIDFPKTRDGMDPDFEQHIHGKEFRTNLAAVFFKLLQTNGGRFIFGFRHKPYIGKKKSHASMYEISLGNSNKIVINHTSKHVTVILNLSRKSPANIELVKNVLAQLMIFIDPQKTNSYIWKYFQFIDEQTFLTNYRAIQRLELTPENFFKYTKDRITFWKDEDGKIESDIEHVSNSRFNKRNWTNKQVNKAIQDDKKKQRIRFDAMFNKSRSDYVIHNVTKKYGITLTEEEKSRMGIVKNNFEFHKNLPERLKTSEDLSRQILNKWVGFQANKKDLLHDVQKLENFGGPQLIQFAKKHNLYPFYRYHERNKPSLLERFINIYSTKLYSSFQLHLKEKQKEGKSVIPCLREACVNDTEFVTLDDIVEIKDERLVFVQVPPKNVGDKEEFVCFDRGTLTFKSLKLGGAFTEWVPNPDSYGVDPEGYGSMPSKTSKLLYKMMFMGGMTIYVDNASVLSKMRLHQPVYRLEKSGDPVRIGNVAGTFGPSQSHGQLPAKQVYSLVSVSVAEIRRCKENTKRTYSETK